MRMEKMNTTIENRRNYAWVPVIEDLGENDNRDVELEKIRGKFQAMWDMATVQRIKIEELDKWLENNELVVPNTQSQAKLNRFRFDAMLKSTSLQPRNK